jgi:hypothetical protein
MKTVKEKKTAVKRSNSGKTGGFDALWKKFCLSAKRWRSAKVPDSLRENFRELLDAANSDKESFCFENSRQQQAEKLLFIKVNNALVEEEFRKRTPRSVLVLLPFCLQKTSCPRRIVWKPENCARCGACPVGDILKIAEQNQTVVRVAERSIFAPRFIREASPELVLAVACPDELFIGILRTPDFRTFGLLNAQPEGYCINTVFNPLLLERAFKKFIRKTNVSKVAVRGTSRKKAPSL